MELSDVQSSSKIVTTSKPISNFLQARCAPCRNICSRHLWSLKRKVGTILENPSISQTCLKITSSYCSYSFLWKVGLVVCLLYNASISTNELYCAMGIRNILRGAGDKHTNKLTEKTQKRCLAWSVWR